MRTITSKVFLALALFAALAAAPGGQARGQWVQTNGEYAHGEIFSLATSGTNLIADIQDSWYFSSDSGKSWNQENGPGYRVQSFVMFKDTLFALAQGDISFSTDHGEQWGQYNAYLSYESYDICIGTDSSNLFIGTSDSGIYRYDELWDQWVPCNVGLPYQSGSYPQIRTFATMDSVLFVGTGNNGILRSKDHGKSWQSVGNARFQASSASMILVVNGNTIYDGTYEDGVFVSTDRGESWTNPDIGDYGDEAASLAVMGNNVFVYVNGNVDGVYRSTDNGTSWKPSGAGLPSIETTWISTIQALGSKLIMGTGSGGFFISTDSGTTWTASDSGLLFQLSCTKLSANSKWIYAGTSDGLYFSSNEGLVWISLGPFLQEYATTAPPIITVETFDSNIYASTLFARGDDAQSFYSKDNGFDWEAESLFYPSDLFNHLAKIGSSLFISTYKNGVCISTDTGANWAHINNGLLHNVIDTFYDTTIVTNRYRLTYDSISVNIQTINKAQIISSLGVDGTNLLAGTEAGIYLTTNNGSDWVVVDSQIKSVTSFATLGSMVFAGSGSGVFVSNDNGVNWVKTNRGLGDTIVNCLAVSGIDFFAGTSDSGVYLSTDSGKSWKAVNASLGNEAINDLLVDSSMLFAGTQAGVWRRPLSDFGISSVVQTPVVAQPAIQSFPNPFTQSTEITFTSPAAGYAEVSIVNALGAEVARLYSGTLEVGNHSIAWKAGDLSPGNYWCVVRMNGHAEQIGLLLEK